MMLLAGVQATSDIATFRDGPAWTAVRDGVVREGGGARLAGEPPPGRGGSRVSRAQIVEAADRERRRIARDLHDGLQSRLVLLGMSAERLRIDATASPRTRADAAELESGLQAAITELREIVHGLMPAALVERGLYAAAQELADRMPIPTALECDPGGAPLPDVVESTSYRVISEALANAVKHSRARSLVIRLDHSGDRLRIEVSDDGVGGAHLNGGAGMRGMADRVDALDGVLVVDSPLGGGTRVAVEVPCAS